MKTLMKLVALTLAMMMALCSFALADDPYSQTVDELPDTDQGSDVYATYSVDQSADPVYCVTLTWGDMEFIVYEDMSDYVWDPVTHTYTPGEGGTKYTWEPAHMCGNLVANEVSVKNSSNTDLTIDAWFSYETIFDDADVTYTTAMSDGTGITVIKSGEAMS